MPTKEFVKFNKQRERNGQTPFANPRNATGGSLKLLDPKTVAQRPLDVVCYAVGEIEGLSFETHLELLGKLKGFGLKIPPKYWVCKTINQAESKLDELERLRHEFPFDMDGGVLKVNERKFYDKLGATAKSPRWAIAYKYEPEQALTKVRSIKVQVGRTGILTPVAEFDPVTVAGSTINRATLHNIDEVRRKDVRTGDKIYVHKAGDVIPEVASVDKQARTGNEKEFKMPSKCPVCGQPVTRREGEVATRCENLQCPAQLKRWLEYFASRNAMDIDGLGESLIEQLVDRNLVSSPANLYDLTKEQINNLDRMADKSAQNLLDSLEESKHRECYRIIYALGIDYVGARMARILADNFKDIDALMEASPDELREIPEIGPVAAKSIAGFFASERHRSIIRKLRKHGLNFNSRKKEKQPHPLADKTFVLTGSLSNFTRKEAEDKIEALGGRCTSTISKNTSYLIAGSDPGSKLDKAHSLGIKVLSEDDFLKMARE